MNNFRDIAASLVDSGGGVTVRTPLELEEFVITMISDDDAHRRRSEAALTSVKGNRGAGERIASRIVEILDR